jgi:hypothetical protein
MYAAAPLAGVRAIVLSVPAIASEFVARRTIPEDAVEALVVVGPTFRKFH